MSGNIFNDPRIFIRKKWINIILNSETYSSFKGFIFDQKILCTKIRLNLQRNEKKSDNVLRYD